ncbi:MAG: monovalent cation/H+ antiporter complex subunit F [Thermoanaerobacterales bacterium]
MEGLVIALALVLLLVAGACYLVRLVVGPSLADRIVALDGLVVVIVAAVFVDAVRDDSPRFLDITLVVAMVGFTGATAAARFVERRGG